MKRREFMASAGAAGAAALTGGMSAKDEELDLKQINADIDEHRQTYRGQNIYAGTVNKLYDDVAYWPEGVLGQKTLSSGHLESALGKEHTDSEVRELAKDEMYHKLGFNFYGLNQDVQIVGPNMDFPEKRLLEDGEAEIHLIPLKNDKAVHSYVEDLASDVESAVSDQLPGVDLDVKPSYIEGGVQNPEEAILESQKAYLENDPSVVQVYFSDQIEGEGGSSTPNSNMATVTLPSESPDEWSEAWDDHLRHVTIHESIGHSLLDINFHSFGRDDVMSYNEKAGYTTEFSGPTELWVNSYLNSDMELEDTTTEVAGEEFDAVQAQIVPGEVPHEEDLRVTRNHLETILEDRYDVSTEALEFTGYDQRTRTDEAFGDEEVVDIHTFRHGNQEYRMEVDNYLRGIEKL